ncbi:MAG: DUF131 domain-containing protein [Thermoplasmata archaeon]
MNRILLYLGLIILIASIMLAIYGVFKGWMLFGIFFFPIIFGFGLFSAIVALLMIISMFLIFISFIQDEQIKSEMGGAVLIGPIPIIFGTSTRIILLAIILLLLFIIFLIILIL